MEQLKNDEVFNFENYVIYYNNLIKRHIAVTRIERNRIELLNEHSLSLVDQEEKVNGLVLKRNPNLRFIEFESNIWIEFSICDLEMGLLMEM